MIRRPWLTHFPFLLSRSHLGKATAFPPFRHWRISVPRQRRLARPSQPQGRGARWRPAAGSPSRPATSQARQSMHSRARRARVGARRGAGPGAARGMPTAPRASPPEKIRNKALTRKKKRGQVHDDRTTPLDTVQCIFLALVLKRKHKSCKGHLLPAAFAPLILPVRCAQLAAPWSHQPHRHCNPAPEG